MSKKTARDLKVLVIFSIFLLGILYFGKARFAAAVTTHLVISEVQIAGSGGINEDFVEIYNPTESTYDLNGHRLVKRTAAGTSDSSIKAWSSETLIPAHGYYLWANSTWTPSVTADATTAATLAADNGVALRQGVEDTGAIIDSVAWGTVTNAFVETSPFATNPEAGTSIERVGDDTNNNSVNFVVQQSPNPQNLGAAPTPTPTDEVSPTPTDKLTPTPTGEPSPTESLVVINEVAWAGTDLTGWTLLATDGAPSITLSGTVPAQGYFLLERSGDDTVKNVAADQIYSGALSNSGEILELKNSSAQLLDAANSNGGGWPGGDSSAKKSMERIDPLLFDTDDNWATNNGTTINGTDATDNPILGTPKAINSTPNVSPSPTPSESVSPTPTVTVSPTPSEEVTPTPTKEPTTTPTVSPQPTVQPSPSPSPTPTPGGNVIGRFWFPGKTITCTINFKIRSSRFFIMIIPVISCK